MDVSIVVCTHDGATRIPATLTALAHLRIPAGIEVECIIVDSASIDQTCKVIRSARLPFPVRLIVTHTRGQSFALNIAVAAASGAVILFTDDDCIPHAGWLAAYHEATQRYPDAGYLFGPIIPLYEQEPPKWWQFAPRSLRGRDQGNRDIRYTQWQREAYPIGANMCIRRCVMDFGLRFDERLGPGVRLGVGADTKLGQDLLRLGYSAYYIAAARVQHRVAAQRMEWSYLKRRQHVSGRASVYYGADDRFTSRLRLCVCKLLAILASRARWLVAIIQSRPLDTCRHELESTKAWGAVIECLTTYAKGKAFRGSQT